MRFGSNKTFTGVKQRRAAHPGKERIILPRMEANGCELVPNATRFRQFFWIVLLVPLLLTFGCNRGKPAGNAAQAADPFVETMTAGKTYYDKNDGVKAVAAFQKAVALKPENLQARLNLVNAHLLASQAAEALAQAGEALKLDANSAAAHYLAGSASLRLAKNEDAVKELQIAFQMDPSAAAVAFQLGRAQMELGHLEDAMTALQDALQLEPEHPAAHYVLSQALVRAGRQDDATRELEAHQQIAAKRGGAPLNASAYERCQYTIIKVPFVLEQPDAAGIPITFRDASDSALAEAKGFAGPVGVIDYDRNGTPSLFARDAAGYRILKNAGGKFSPVGDPIPLAAGETPRQVLVGDLQNDRLDEIVVLGEPASHVFKVDTNGVLSDATALTGLRGLSASAGALADLDFTGKLDLFAVTTTNNAVQLFRNLGSMYFRNITETSGIPANVTGVREIHVDDWSGDDIMDVILGAAGQPPLPLAKLRGGPLAVTNQASTWPAAQTFTTGDLNNDLRMDMVAAADGKLICSFGGLEKKVEIPVPASADVRGIELVDYDNDGWLDIVAYGNGLYLWRNGGDKGFQDRNAVSALNLAGVKIDAVFAADFDQDGDSDLLIASGDRLRLLSNEGGNANNQLKVRLYGNRSNASGLGVKVEVAAGGLHLMRTVSRAPVEIGVGRHKQLDAVTVHWFDLASPVLDVVVDKTPMNAVELILPTGSCPYLYAWDGKQYRFVTDILGAAPLGLPVAEHHYIEADTDELIALGTTDQFKPLDGHYRVQITEELREVLYLDQARLVAVDHPPKTSAHSTSKLRSRGPFPGAKITLVGDPMVPKRATRDDGLDITEALRRVDQSYASPTRLRVPQLRGLAEPYAITMDFGEIPTDRSMALVLNGWLRFGGGMANVAASHDPTLPFPFPQLEVESETGEWKKIDIEVGAPAGKTKTIVVDLTGKIPAGAKRLRLQTAFEIHWDAASLCEIAQTKPRVTELPVAKTDLHWRGFSEHENFPAFQPLTPVYNRVRPSPPWLITPSGWCTRYGVVDELVNARDNALVLLNGGDELTLSFDAGKIPAAPEGWTRDFFLFVSGWDKDADFHVARGTTVEPLPYHGLDDQTYGSLAPLLPSQEEWARRYNTRWVGERTFARKK